MAELLRYVLSHWPTAFLLTLVIELPLYVLVTRGAVPPWRAALAGAACSAVTHPLLWFVWVPSIEGYTFAVVTGEALVAAVEAGVFLLLARPPTRRLAVAASFVANGASWGLGALLAALVRA